MALFKKKKTVNFHEEGVSAQLNPKVMDTRDNPTHTQEIESIIKTTDSMSIVSSGYEQIEDEAKLQQVREGILHSYDFARRKITTQFQEIINSGTYIDNQFLAVQITMKNYEKGWDVKVVESTVARFLDAIPEQIAIGKTVYFSNQFIIEPIVYVNKILPSWKITPNFAALLNAITWEQLTDKLIREGEILADGKEIIRELVQALSQNIENGYYVKMSRFIVLQISSVNASRIILFSNDTLIKLNEVYVKFQKLDKKNIVDRTDASEHYVRTKENVEKGFFMDGVKTDTVKEAAFVPKDLVEDLHEDDKLQEETEEVADDVQVSTTEGVKVDGEAFVASTNVNETDEVVEEKPVDINEEIKEAIDTVKAEVAPEEVKVADKKDAKSKKATPAKKEASKPASKPAAKAAAKPAPKAAAKSAAKATAKPAAKPAAKPVAKPTAKPAPKPASKPAAKAAAKPAPKAAAKPAAKPVAKPAAKPAAKAKKK